MAADELIVFAGWTDLEVDAAGPDPLVVQLADGIDVVLPDEPLLLFFEAIGVPGRDGASGTITAVATTDLRAGTPVAIDRATGKFIAADPTYKPSAFVAGLVAADAAAGFIATVAAASLTLADWTLITGTAQLVHGVLYFLAAGGGLTTIVPVSGCVTLVGKALDSSTLLITPQLPIQL